MENYLTQLAKLKDQYQCEVVYAGDIFDDWRVDAELINFALKYLPSGYAVPGQHELPHHRYEDRHKSPYWTLVQAEKIEDLPPGQVRYGGKSRLHGFPWGCEICPCDETGKTMTYPLKVAVIHAYCWNDGNEYPNAPNSAHVRSWAKRLAGYDVAIFGDNHKGFMYQTDGFNVLNNGFFIPRTSDEAGWKPCVGVVYEDGHVDRVMLDTSKDKWLDEEEAVKSYYDDPEVEAAVQTLKKLGNQGETYVDFRKILVRSLDNETLSELAKEIVIEALERSKR